VTGFRVKIVGRLWDAMSVITPMTSF
jgi:hypothetical protein